MAMETTKSDEGSPVRTGIEALDDILGGGFTPNRVYLVEGDPGSGKTTLALQCLLEGARQGEKVLYVTLSETKAELAAVAESHGWSLDGIDILELVATGVELEPDNQYTMFQPSEVELGVTTKAILAEVERLKPTRVVIDSLSEMRLLAQNPLRYRRQILALKQFFIGRRVHGVPARRPDVRGRGPAAPEHRPRRGQPGTALARVRGRAATAPRHEAPRPEVPRRLPRLRHRPRAGSTSSPGSSPGSTSSGQTRGLLKSGNAELDALVGGGFDVRDERAPARPRRERQVDARHPVRPGRGGPRRAGRRSSPSTRGSRRCSSGWRASGWTSPGSIESGPIAIQQVDTAELSPGEFAHLVRRAAEGEGGRPGAKVVVIDSLNGYLNAMPEERFLITQLHELLTYLGHKGVVTFLVVAQHGLLGRDADPGGHDLPGRHRRPLPLLRGDGRGAAGHLGRQEAERPARADDPRVPAGRLGHPCRRSRSATSTASCPGPRRSSGTASRSPEGRG